MKDLIKKYSFSEIEKKWQQYWVDNKIFKFDWNDTKRENVYAIDTPPPTVSGQLHMGHIFSFTQAEFVARFQRMNGKNVFYPIGFDDNGLPTEKYIEQLKKIKGKKMPREDFIKICQENVHVAEDKFEALFKSAGFSFDWDEKYQTISEKSRRISQMSFVDLYNKGVLYQKEEPVIWDVIDQTALAQTEVEEMEFDGEMNYLKFELISSHSPLEGESRKTSSEGTMSDSVGGQILEIMTTRPELLPACVAVMYHPDDKAKYEGKTAITPLGVEVPMIADDKVDREKGTGVVMLCTFGDQTDVEWFKKNEREYNLELRIILNEKGVIISFNNNVNHLLNIREFLFDNKYNILEGLFITKARAKILELLKEDGKLTREPVAIKHSVKTGERSKHPVEILVEKQWFIKVLDIKEELHTKASECDWHPKWMESRIHNWIDGLAWDWCISRQRFSGIPIPVWYIKNKNGETVSILPAKEQLPIDPTIDLPKDFKLVKEDKARIVKATKDILDKNGKIIIEKETERVLIPERDIMDTWATSSVSPQLSSQGITDDLVADEKRYKTLSLPFDLRPQAHEIIRTWAFCTIVKAHYHQNTIPWKNLMISGWCLAKDKTKMSKSKGNSISPTNLLAEKGTDAVRYWASNSNLGNDIAYSEDAIKIGQKLVTKLFNASKFASFHFQNLAEKIETAKADIESGKIFETADLWLISKLSKTIESTTKAFEEYQYAKARENIEDFFWNDFCDNYLEIAKVRCYGADGLKYQNAQLSEDERWKINQAQQSGIRTIHYVLNAILKLFAPFVPHVTEEIFSCIYEDEFLEKKSLHARGMWAKVEDFAIDEKSEFSGELAVKVLAEVRKYKSDNNVSMKNELERLTISSSEDEKVFSGILEDLKNVCNAKEVLFEKGSVFYVIPNCV